MKLAIFQVYFPNCLFSPRFAAVSMVFWPAVPWPLTIGHEEMFSKSSHLHRIPSRHWENCPLNDFDDFQFCGDPPTKPWFPEVVSQSGERIGQN